MIHWSRGGQCRVVVGSMSLILWLVWPSPVRATDLLQVYRAALRNDATYQGARHALAAALQAVPQARSALLPHLSANGDARLTRASAAFTGMPPVNRQIHSWDWTLQLDQPVVDLTKFYTYRESQYALAQARARFSQARADLILKVARAYFNVLVAQEGVLAAKAQVAATRQQLAQVKHGLRSGTSVVTDVDEAKARLERARFKVVSAENELEDRRADLQEITDVWPSKLAALGSETVIPRPRPADPAAWIRQARFANPVVHEREAAVSEAQEAIRRARAGYLPTLDFTASYGDNYSSNNLSNPVNFSTRYKSGELGLRLAVPLYAGGETDAQVAEAVAEREQATSELLAAQRQAAVDARQAFAGIGNGLAQIRALSESLWFGKSAVKGNEAGYRLGLRINVDVLNSQEQVYATRRDLAKARYDTLFQGLKLKAAAGSLSEADLVTLNALLMKPLGSR